VRTTYRDPHAVRSACPRDVEAEKRGKVVFVAELQVAPEQMWVASVAGRRVSSLPIRSAISGWKMENRASSKELSSDRSTNIRGGSAHIEFEKTPIRE